jgi:hypothetical protein
MTKLIKEAKRFQELAGINEIKIVQSSYKSEPGGNFTWWLPNNRRDPDQLIHLIEDDEYISQSEDEGGTYNEPWAHHGSTIRSKDMDSSTIRNYVYDDNEYKRDEKGDYIFIYLDDDSIKTSGYIEGKDYIIIHMKNIIPLMQAFKEEGASHGFLKYEFYDGYTRYLEDNNGVLETNTPYWEKLVEIVGEENIPEYTRYLKNLGIKIV